MRILHTSDFHFRQTWFHWLTEKAPGFDACCLTGDLLDMLGFGTAQGMSTQVRWVKEWAKAFPGRLYLCSGNHDWWVEDRYIDTMANGRWVQWLRRTGSVFVDGDVDALPGYAVHCQPWVGGLGQRHETGLPALVLAHAPPTGLPVSFNYEGSDFGDFQTDEILRALPVGSLILSGHVHTSRHWHAERKGVLCFNPGVSDNPEPNYIVLDTARHAAALFTGGQVRDSYQWHSTA
ncbi:MAG: metallophosphoesterase [Cephaloticoccus sp.]|nr:metallophosphoesterase [Cephaloticoccus sp.]